MFDGDFNVQIGDDPIQFCYQKLTAIHGVKHTISLCFDDISKISICESDYYNSQGNIQLIWFWQISQTYIYIQIKIL